MAIEIRTELNNEEQLFLALLADAVHGKSLTGTVQADWQAVFSLAGKHHVLPMVMEAAYSCPGIPEALLGQAQAAAMNIVIQQTVRTRVFLELYKKLRLAGYEPVVVKGAVCRSLYPQPDQRPSNDEDLLIRPEDLPAVHALLLQSGLTADSDVMLSPDVQEIAYTGPLRIELHTALFPGSSLAYGELNVFFDGAMERTINIEVEGVPLRTLCPTDHLLYLICHAYKHFLHAGVGVRQICDMELMASTFGGDIDWEHIDACCRQVRMEVFAAALFRIGERYLGFSQPPVFASSEVDEGPLLADILSAGVYVTGDDMDRVHSSNITLEAVAAQRHGRRSKGIRSSLFPPRDYMETKFPYVKTYPWLLPAAWVQRMFEYVKDRKRVDPKQSVQIGKERVQLLKEYNVID